MLSTGGHLSLWERSFITLAWLQESFGAFWMLLSVLRNGHEVPNPYL
jgi:hypothetical protein